MRDRFVVDHLDVERLLAEWRWLCPGPMTLIARTAFGDLFLRDESGKIFYLNSAVGRLTEIADSEAKFRELAETPKKREEWFAESDAQAAAANGLEPNASQCIAFSMPLVLAERGVPNPPYLVDVYECLSFLGDLHGQISRLPDGGEVRLKFQRKPPL